MESFVHELPFPGHDPTHAIEISMYQFEATLGVKYRFGADAVSLK